ncbi:MAG: ABC transporter substrate-binding protein [Chloroflexi bacterium]|nr:ABC transporter substrate-binding protein [Chloroflexota bacterium]MYF64826.1 ABC transporter substrate-binding protein [Chloroflexota bacterium]MYK34405.1 ABC transporter substrate-binding protein [Chloroflexota bacterium]
MATGDYGHTRPLKDGTVTSEWVEFEHVEVPNIINAFRRMIRDLEFDVSEMALSTYLCARAHGIPITALPVFLVRALHHGSIVYNVKSGVRTPTDLHGRRVGVRAYTVTTGVWNRGILQSEYGVNLDEVTWVINSDEHVAEYQTPPNVESAPFDRSLADLLRDGEIDAAIGVAPSVEAGFAPLIPDAREAGISWLRSTGVYPINHTLVVRNEHLAANPGLAAELFGLFKQAKECFLPTIDTAPALANEDARARDMHGVLGGDPLPFGVEANRASLETFIGFTVDQQVIPEAISPEEAFEPSTRKLEG